MFTTKPYYLQSKGFTLIEVIIALSIATIIALPLFLILNFTINSYVLAEERDNLILDGNYTIEFIKSGIKSGDLIIPSEKIIGLLEKYPTNIGFVVMTEGEDEYSYHTYHTKNNKLIRTGLEIEKEEYIDGEYPSPNNFKGFNTVCDFVKNIDKSKLDEENSIITLNLELECKGRSKLELKSDIYIRCDIDY